VATGLLVRIIQKPFRRGQVGGTEPFGKPAIVRLQDCPRVVEAAMTTQQAGEARRSPQLSGQSLLLARLIERPPEEVLCRFRGCGRALQ
jgi:hypothetical protein